ncbi:MAG: UPF0179 family protein [Candidatus Brockarchaeota archaeon]|nr:UPF0179 family protein [Candidatus Brockarchaeota archaeon]
MKMTKYVYLSRGIKPGKVFTYMGEAYECMQCSNRRRCHGALSIGFVYRIERTTDGEGVYCILRGDEVVPYEASLEPLILLAPSGKAKEGASMELKLDDAFCKTDCERIGECPILFNILIAGRRVKVLEKLGSFDCPERKLVLIRAEILD